MICVLFKYFCDIYSLKVQKIAILRSSISRHILQRLSEYYCES